MGVRVVHLEIPAQDADRAQSFYEQLVGWEFNQAMEGMDYRMADLGEGQGAATWPAEGGESGLRVYFGVDDIDASLAKARELGGEAEEKAPVPGMGWFAACKDPEGNTFHFWQTDSSAG
jgi:predicted enzyme related to lactoylglutathione lyase